MTQNARFYLKAFLILVAALILFGYSWYQSNNLISGAEIFIASPRGQRNRKRSASKNNRHGEKRDPFHARRQSYLHRQRRKFQRGNRASARAERNQIERRGQIPEKNPENPGDSLRLPIEIGNKYGELESY